MKKRVFAFTEDQCDRVFHSLPLEKKRLILHELDDTIVGTGEYVDPRLYRDILRLIVHYDGCNLRTWGMLKQTCRHFCEVLGKTPPIVQRIRKYIDEPLFVDRFTAFFPWLHRFIKKTGIQPKRPLAELKLEVMSPKVVRNSIPFKGAFRVKYPSGYIIIDGKPRGTIFDENITTLLFKRNAFGIPTYKYVTDYDRPMKEIYTRVKREWATRLIV